MKKAKLLLSLSSVALLAGLTGCGSVKGAEYTKGNPVKVGLICLHDSNSTYDANFINALKEALSKGRKTLKSVDKILLQWQARDDIEKNGYTTISEDWDKNMEETMKIIKTKWVDND